MNETIVISTKSWQNELHYLLKKYRSKYPLFITSKGAINRFKIVVNNYERTIYVEEALHSAYQNISKLHCLHSYFRTDVGQTLWPIGVGF